MVDINLNANLKVPAIEKLLDYCASGVGAIGGPMLARWRARAAADVSRIDAEGQADVLRIKARGHTDATSLIAAAQVEARNNFAVDPLSVQGELNLSEEIESRLTFQEQKRQSNIRAVAKMAAEGLNGKDVANHDVDHDWVARFFADVQDVTSEHMQRIWAKILAGEVETPGRTSLYTLAILKNMTQRDAELFEDVSRFVFDALLDGGFILFDEKYAERISGFPIYDIVLRLQSYGLLSMSTGLTMRLKITPKGCVIKGGDRLYKISTDTDAETQEIRIPCLALTPQGLELYRINASIINDDYLHAFAQFLSDIGHYKLECAQNIENFEGEVRCDQWTLVEPRSPSENKTGP